MLISFFKYVYTLSITKYNYTGKYFKIWYIVFFVLVRMVTSLVDSRKYVFELLMALIVHSDKVGNPKPGNNLTNNLIPTKSNPAFENS